MSDLTITNADLWKALAAPQGVKPALIQLAALDLPIVVSNQLRKLKRKAVDAVQDVNESHAALTEKYVQRDEAGAKVPTPDGNGYLLADAEAYRAEYDALMAQPVTLADCRKITLKELDGAKLSADALDALEAFLED